uniref:Very-long-chain 3-oxoacyl-CoA synthase n=1 Tax=Panagrellus redivivus TaxID=6233 RepID=A0A7E4V9T0_PANRE
MTKHGDFYPKKNKNNQPQQRQNRQRNAQDQPNAQNQPNAPNQADEPQPTSSASPANTPRPAASPRLPQAPTANTRGLTRRQQEQETKALIIWTIAYLLGYSFYFTPPNKTMLWAYLGYRLVLGITAVRCFYQSYMMIILFILSVMHHMIAHIFIVWYRTRR